MLARALAFAVSAPQCGSEEKDSLRIGASTEAGNMESEEIAESAEPPDSRKIVESAELAPSFLGFEKEGAT